MQCWFVGDYQSTVWLDYQIKLHDGIKKSFLSHFRFRYTFCHGIPWETFIFLHVLNGTGNECVFPSIPLDFIEIYEVPRYTKWNGCFSTSGGIINWIKVGMDFFASSLPKINGNEKRSFVPYKYSLISLN